MVGMIVANVDANVDANFDNLKIWSDDPAPPAPGHPPVKQTPSGEMVLIAGGDLIMGSYQREEEQPPHIVAVDSFYMDRTEVTNAARFRVQIFRCRIAPVKTMHRPRAGRSSRSF